MGDAPSLTVSVFAVEKVTTGALLGVVGVPVGEAVGEGLVVAVAVGEGLVEGAGAGFAARAGCRLSGSARATRDRIRVEAQARFEPSNLLGIEHNA